jgi:ABC-type phosphate transport system substrate-binding protein
MTRLLSSLLLLSFALCAAVATVSASETPAYLVIVNPRNSASSLERTFAQDAFLKRIKRWPNGATLRPVDREASSNARRRFSREVLGRSVEAVKAYWQQRIFSGRDVPPPQFDHNQKVVSYVLEHEGAVGYVSGDADLRGCRVVQVTR